MYKHLKHANDKHKPNQTVKYMNSYSNLLYIFIIKVYLLMERHIGIVCMDWIASLQRFMSETYISWQKKDNSI